MTTLAGRTIKTIYVKNISDVERLVRHFSLRKGRLWIQPGQTVPIPLEAYLKNRRFEWLSRVGDDFTGLDQPDQRTMRGRKRREPDSAAASEAAEAGASEADAEG